MSVMEIMQALTQSLNASDNKFSFKTDGDFNRPLNIGEVIKGRVLRHYEGNHYLVSFSGEEKVVDSSVPLKTGELIHGRVVGVDDKVHMKRVFNSNPQEQNNTLQLGQGVQLKLNRQEQFLVDLFKQYQGKLSENDLTNVVKAMSASRSPVTYAVSSLVLSKLGLPQSTELLSAMSKVLDSGQAKRARAILPDQALQVASDRGHVIHDSVDSIREISELVGFNATKTDLPQSERSANDSIFSNRNDGTGFGGSGVNSKSDSGFGGQKEYNQWKLGTWLLNVQTEGSVAHKLLTLPFMLGGKLVEISVAVFSERQAVNNNSNGYKRVVLSLSTDTLGKVDIEVKIREKHLKMNVTGGDEQGIETVAQHIDELRNVLQENGWEIEEIKYGYKDLENNLAIHSIVEHHITKDSLNQLI